MPLHSSHIIELAYFPETTQGTPPADAAAWVSGGQQVRVHGDTLDVSTFKRAQVEDLRAQTTVYGLNAKVAGLANPEFPFAMLLSGTGATTTAGSQVTATPLGAILTNCLGGSVRTNSTTVDTGSTAIEFDVVSATNLTVGAYVAVAQAAAPSLGYVRRIAAVASTTITLDHDLPFTPASSDLIYGCEVNYIDEGVLLDSAAASGRTFSYLAEFGGAESFEAQGCKTTLGGITIARGELPTLDMQVMASSFSGPETAVSPSWSAAPWGPGSNALGVNTECLLADVGDTDNPLVNVSELTLEPGVPATRVNTVTERQTNMEGTYGFTIAPADTTASLSLVPFDTTLWDDQTAGTFKMCRYGVAGGPGQGWAVELPNCEIMETPERGVADDVSTAKIMLRAHPAAGSGALATSKIVIIRW